MNQLPGVKANTALMNRVKATKTIDQLKRLYSKELTPAERKQVKEAFIAHSNRLKKAAKGKTGQPSTSTKSTAPAPVQPQANTGTGRDGKPGLGTYGKLRPSDNQNRSRNPEAIAARKKRERILSKYPATGVYKNAADEKRAKAALDARYGTGDKPKQQPTGRRRRGGVNNPDVRKNLQKMAAEARTKSAAARSKSGRLPMGPAKKPYKGHRYKTPFGPIMEYNGKKYVRVR